MSGRATRRRGSLARRRNADVFHDEYSVVRFEPSWGLVSLACFLLAVPSRYWVRWLPLEAPHSGVYPWWTVKAMFVLAVAGLISGWVAWSRSERKALAKAALLANGVVLALVLLAYLAMRLILMR